MTIDDPLTYRQLELGARYLADRAPSAEERILHLGMANRYAQLDLGTNPHGQV
ncbi:MAG: hypothetical protein JWO25_1232 [Alphaproteobacteria bacterium]|nr:hypothetical protein [Alphaproteobacteria bacterium]